MLLHWTKLLTDVFRDWKNDINADIYLIDLNTGKTILFERNSYTEPEWSPNGKYALWYNALEKVCIKLIRGPVNG